MDKGMGRHWARHLAVMAIYALVYTVLRYVGFAHWFLPAGFRLLCLLFVPYRYWPALFVGEMLCLAQISYECIDVFGVPYALLKLFPPIALAMPIVGWCRTRLSFFDQQQAVRVDVLLLCTLLLSLATAARDISFLYIAKTPADPKDVPVFWEWACQYFLGNYLGILTVVPLALLGREFVRNGALQSLWKRLSHDRLILDSLGLMLPTIVLMTWLATHVKSEFSLVIRIAMFIPVAWLTLRNGWRGAAVGGSAASIGIALITPVEFDPVTLQAQAFISFAISTLLLLGARISALHAHREKEWMDGRLALQVAQHTLYLGELRMQHAANTIEQISESVHRAHERLLRRMRPFLPVIEEHGYTRHAIATQHEVFRLADGMYPRAWADKGLFHTLNHGAIAHAFDSVDVIYVCAVKGVDSSTLAPSVQLALYRLTCEAAMLLYKQATLSAVHLRVRAGTTNGRSWIVMSMDGDYATNPNEPIPARLACEHFKDRLGATDQGIGALRDQARIYRGAVHVRSMAHGTRLALLLHDVEARPDRVN